MQRILTLLAACLVSAAMAFGQATATDQAPASGTQSNSNTVNATPNSNGTSPSAQRGAAGRTASTPNQALPGNSNPANAASKEGSANGQAVNPNQNASPAVGNPGDTSDNNGMAKDDTGNNPAKGRSNTITNPGTAGTTQWFWIALGIIVGLFLIGILVSRNRARGNIDRTDPALRATDIHSRDEQKRDERIRRVG